MVSLGRLGSIRLHHWHRSDDKRAKHDHPSDFITIVLSGSYTDLGWERDERMTPGTIRRRRAEHRHTVAVDPGGLLDFALLLPEAASLGILDSP